MTASGEVKPEREGHLMGRPSDMPRMIHVVGDGRPGGGTTAVLTLCQEFALQGSVVTVASQAGSYLIEEARRIGMGTIELDFRHRRSSLTLASLLTHSIDALKPDIIHAHGARAGLPVKLMGWKSRVPYVYTVHGFHFLHKRAPVRQIARTIEKACISRAAATIFVSNADLDIARSQKLLRPGAPATVIYNAVKLSDSLTHTRHEKTYDIAFLGRLHYQKNPLILPDILLALQPLQPTLCVIGGGDYEAELRERIENAELTGSVTLLGEQSRDAALSHLARARTLLLPSRWEGLPVSLIEAMHLGVPVVASDIPGNREVVSHEETGFLVRADDPEAYARVLATLLTSDELRDRFSEASLTRARRHFTIDRQVEAHLDVYRRAAELGGLST